MGFPKTIVWLLGIWWLHKPSQVLGPKKIAEIAKAAEDIPIADCFAVIKVDGGALLSLAKKGKDVTEVPTELARIGLSEAASASLVTELGHIFYG